MATQTSSAPTKGDDTEALSPGDFSWADWIGGATYATRSVTIYQQPHLLGKIEEMQGRIRIEADIPERDRGLNDVSPVELDKELAELIGQLRASALTVTVQGRSDARRRRVGEECRKGLPDAPAKEKPDEAQAREYREDFEEALCQLADAIIEPPGITVDHLRRLAETSETQVKMIQTAMTMADRMDPQVDIPFLSESSPSGTRHR